MVWEIRCDTRDMIDMKYFGFIFLDWFNFHKCRSFFGSIVKPLSAFQHDPVDLESYSLIATKIGTRYRYLSKDSIDEVNPYCQGRVRFQ